MMKSDLNSLHGAVVRSHRVSGLALSETAYQANTELSQHEHSAAYFCFVLQGSLSEIYGRRSRRCEPWTLVFHPSGETHSDRFYAPTRCFNLQFENQWTERIGFYLAAAKSPSDFNGGLLAQLATRVYQEFRHSDDLSSLIIEGLTLEILGEAARCAGNSLRNNSLPRWLARTREFLNERFHENLSLAEIAAAVGVHETHLAREFRRFYRCTVGEYVRRLRIEYACRRLADGDASLAEIALAAGFFDQSHFARNFKSQTGMTPHEYRKIWRSR